MMERSLFDFEVDLQVHAGRNYLVLAQQGPGVSRLIGFQVEMAAYNNIPGVVNFSVREKDSQLKLLYDLSGLVNLTNYLRRQKISKLQLTGILDRILKIVLDSKTYFLNEGSFILNVNFIYIDPKTLEVFLLYIPAELAQDITGAFKSLALDISLKTDVNFALDSSIQTLLSRIRDEGSSLQDCRNLLLSMSGEEHHPTVVSQLTPRPFSQTYSLSQDEPRSPHKTVVPAANEPVETEAAPKAENSPKHPIPMRKALLFLLAGISVLSAIISNYWDVLGSLWQLAAGFKYLTFLGVIIAVVAAVIFVIKSGRKSPVSPVYTEPTVVTSSLSPGPSLTGEAGVVLHSDETTLLDGAAWPQHPALNAVDGSEKIIITKNEFTVGRNKETCDYAVLNQSVGRAHVRIIKLKDSYYIVDLDSKNGTYVNGSRLVSNKEYCLKANDRVTLANSEWVFELN